MGIASGNTSDSGPDIPGSNPGSPAIKNKKGDSFESPFLFQSM